MPLTTNPTTSPPLATPAPARASYLQGLIAEIRILVRAVSGDPQQTLSSLQVATLDDKGAPCMLSYPQFVAALAEDAPATDAALLRRIGLLQSARDALVAKTTPATGLSIVIGACILPRSGG